MESTVDNYEERIKHYIYIYIYSNFIFLIILCRFSINIINFVNPCRNSTLQQFATVAEKKELNGTN